MDATLHREMLAQMTTEEELTENQHEVFAIIGHGLEAEMFENLDEQAKVFQMSSAYEKGHLQPEDI